MASWARSSVELVHQSVSSKSNHDATNSTEGHSTDHVEAARLENVASPTKTGNQMVTNDTGSIHGGGPLSSGGCPMSCDGHVDETCLRLKVLHPVLAHVFQSKHKSSHLLHTPSPSSHFHPTPTVFPRTPPSHPPPHPPSSSSSSPHHRPHLFSLLFFSLLSSRLLSSLFSLLSSLFSLLSSLFSLPLPSLPCLSPSLFSPLSPFSPSLFLYLHPTSLHFTPSLPPFTCSLLPFSPFLSTPCTHTVPSLRRHSLSTRKTPTRKNGHQCGRAVRGCDVLLS